MRDRRRLLCSLDGLIEWADPRGGRWTRRRGGVLEGVQPGANFTAERFDGDAAEARGAAFETTQRSPEQGRGTGEVARTLMMEGRAYLN
ncbi:MAG TPA: hypothetical protein VK764_02335 [Terracidiphilus sp.]|nr:hypothetical protein [Terracidiphilus sp.]